MELARGADAAAVPARQAGRHRGPGSHRACRSRVRAEALGLSVQWWGPRAKPDAGYPRAESLLRLRADSDILVRREPRVRANAGQIDREVLAALGPDGVLVNVSRGFLVDEPALIRALEIRHDRGRCAGRVRAGAPDAQEWSRFDNVVLSPHIAGYTRRSRRRHVRAAAREHPTPLRRRAAADPGERPAGEALAPSAVRALLIRRNQATIVLDHPHERVPLALDHRVAVLEHLRHGAAMRLLRP